MYSCDHATLLFSVNESSVPCQATWYHNDAMVVPTPKCAAIDDGGTSFRLCVRNLEITDDGVWAVEVANDLGAARDQCRLTLKGRNG